MDVPPEAFHCSCKYLLMVEGKGRMLIHGEPCCFFGVVTPDDLGRLHEGVPCYGNHALARVAVRIGENSELDDGGGRGQGRLF